MRLSQGVARFGLFGLKLLALTFAGLFFVFAIRKGVSPYSMFGLQLLLASGLFLIASYTRHRRMALILFGYAFGFFLFIQLRKIADDSSFVATQYEYPILLDSLILPLAQPNAWLQDLLYVPGRISPLDLILALVYFSYFLVPHALLLWTWRMRPLLCKRAGVALILTVALGLLIYFLVPTAPPWLASDEGRINDVHRLMPEISAFVAGDAYERAAATVDRNPVAAMPSLHVALTVVVALTLAQFGRPWSRLGVVYVVAMCFALVYLGEHYIIDEVAGVVLALAAWRITSLATPRFARITLEPSPGDTVARIKLHRRTQESLTTQQSREPAE